MILAALLPWAALTASAAALVATTMTLLRPRPLDQWHAGNNRRARLDASDREREIQRRLTANQQRQQQTHQTPKSPSAQPNPHNQAPFPKKSKLSRPNPSR